MEGKPQSAASRKPKITFSLDTPYTDVQWPIVSADCQTEILDMLCSLLSPIGEHISRNVTPSKGKRAKKRKRKIDRTVQDQSAAFSDEGLSEKEALARLEMHNHLTIGFNTTTRYLENLARKSSPSKTEVLGPVMAIKTSTRAPLEPTNMKPLAAVFVARSSQPPALCSHLPLLAKTASLAAPSSPSIRIISLPEGAEDRLKTILGIRRLGVVGLIDGAPSASLLLELVRHSVPEMEVPWLQEAVEGAYLAVKVNASQNCVPPNPRGGTPSSESITAPVDSNVV